MVMLKKVIASKNIKNGLWLYMLQTFNTIIPLITIPYITRILGKDGYGTFSIALNIIAYLQVLVEYGFGMSATREVAISDKSNSTVCKLFSSIIFARLILFVVSIIIAVVYLIATKSEMILWISMSVMLICLIGYCVQQNWLFQGMQDMKYISIISMVSRSISTLLIFCFVKCQEDIVLYSFLYSISPFLDGFISVAMARIKYKLKLVRVTVDDIIGQLKKSWYVFTTQLSSKVFGAIGVTFLGIFSSTADVGTFSAIQKIPNIMILAWTPISQILYPVVSQQMKNSFSIGYAYVKKYQQIFVPLFSIIALGISVFSKAIVQIAFGEEYVAFYYWIIPLSIWFVIAVNNNFLGIQTLLSSGHDKEYSICFQICIVCTIVLNFVLIYFYGGNGASIAPMLSEAILSITLIYQIHKLKSNNGEK